MSPRNNEILAEINELFPFRITLPLEGDHAPKEIWCKQMFGPDAIVGGSAFNPDSQWTWYPDNGVRFFFKNEKAAVEFKLLFG